MEALTVSSTKTGLGSMSFMFQAKRWQDNVQRRQIQEFAGALEGQRELEGNRPLQPPIFPEGAREYVNTINSKIVLISGRQLAELMIEYNVGVSTVKTYELKRVDSDYFIETDDSPTDRIRKNTRTMNTNLNELERRLWRRRR